MAHASFPRPAFFAAMVCFTNRYFVGLILLFVRGVRLVTHGPSGVRTGRYPDPAKPRQAIGYSSGGTPFSQADEFPSCTPSQSDG
jgi:hypothetical protein